MLLTLISDGIEPGDNFRLLFVTSTTRNASSSNIADYNAHTQAAANGNKSLKSFKERSAPHGFSSSSIGAG